MQLRNHDSASYMRTARNKVPRAYSADNIQKLEIGKGFIHREGDDVAILACGVMLNEAMNAHAELEKEGIHATVVDMHTIKPLDTKLLDELTIKCGAFVTAEDHSIIGGLAGAVSEHVVANQPVPIEMVGVQDRFGESGGSDELLQMLGLKSSDIVDAVKRVMARK